MQLDIFYIAILLLAAPNVQTHTHRDTRELTSAIKPERAVI